MQAPTRPLLVRASQVELAVEWELVCLLVCLRFVCGAAGRSRSETF